jgi:hypothetical protein
LPVLVLEPEPADVMLFLHNPTNFEARRAILEHAYKSTRERASKWDVAALAAGGLHLV